MITNRLRVEVYLTTEMVHIQNIHFI